MNNAINWLGSAAGALGILLCAVSALMRVLGTHVLGGFGMQAGFELGVGLMVFACLAKLEVIARRG